MSAVAVPAVVPVAGTPAGVRFDGRSHWVWHGPDPEDRDVVACERGRVLSFPTAAACAEAAARRGWAAAEASDDGTAGRVADLEPAQAWLRGGALSLESGSALQLWNWADDVARSTHRPLTPRGRDADHCYRQLFAAEVPWFFELTEHRPTWSARTRRVLRAALGRGVHLLRASLPR